MAQLVLSSLGRAFGARFAPAAFRAVASAIGSAVGSVIGGRIDQSLFGVSRNLEGPRLADLQVQGSSEGASIPAIYGRVRVAGQVIWAARFTEIAETEDVGTGGKGGGGRTRVTNYRYTLSFAVGLCEGEIVRLGRAWANGSPFDLSRHAWRLHEGREDQAADPLIEAIEGAENAPAYRGLAYIVFEDLPIEEFGNVIPQLSFEVMRAAPGEGARLETLVEGVCLVPGAGEFVYATVPVRRAIGPGQEAPENVHVAQARANLPVALDQLQADLPSCNFVMLVVAAFGDDLRCGHCEIRPGVEIAAKETTPIVWRALGADRASAHLVSQVDGAPAFGGTPADETVLQAIAELKARGFAVGLYPFVLMDVPAGNALPDPYGASAQAAYPWRGRITLAHAPGEVGSTDRTSAATAEVAAFFGSATPAQFSASGGGVVYSGPAEWRYRRFVLHLAKLAQIAGGVDAFVIGSELRGLTTIRDSATHFPAVDQLRTLAADVRTLLAEPATTVTYAADWSEYRGHQPADGSGDVFFHLDALWADTNISCVGVDWYPPLADWRDGESHMDAQDFRSGHALAYLQSRIESGGDYDWHYASDADRADQTRTPISDGAYSEPWVFRAKDIRNFWANAHHDRPGGVRSGTATAWIAQSKPVWLIELGCPAVDKGANAPNLFIDDKSSESALPPFSSGARDDLIQRRTLEAYLSYWTAPTNPVSTVDGRAMIERMFAWCWDARPHPAFPARDDVWADAESWRRGHWLSGRAGLATLGDVVNDLCRRAGVDDADVSGLSGIVAGYVVDAPSAARAALEPLMAAYDMQACEHGGVLKFTHPAEAERAELSLDDLDADSIAALYETRADATDAPVEARVRFRLMNCRPKRWRSACSACVARKRKRCKSASALHNWRWSLAIACRCWARASPSCASRMGPRAGSICAASMRSPRRS